LFECGFRFQSPVNEFNGTGGFADFHSPCEVIFRSAKDRDSRLSLRERTRAFAERKTTIRCSPEQELLTVLPLGEGEDSAKGILPIPALRIFTTDEWVVALVGELLIISCGYAYQPRGRFS
jgi:hypothetical protein